MWPFGRDDDLSNKVFDWDAYYEDIERRMPFDERMKKMKSFKYWVYPNETKAAVDERSKRAK